MRPGPVPSADFSLIGSNDRARLEHVPTTSDLERMLRESALRVTRPRVAVLSVVHDHPHADTDSITDAARQQFGGVSHQAVYDVLRTLTDVGLVRRIQPTGSVARYEARGQPPPRRLPVLRRHLRRRLRGGRQPLPDSVGRRRLRDRRGRGHLLGPLPRVRTALRSSARDRKGTPT